MVKLWTLILVSVVGVRVTSAQQPIKPPTSKPTSTVNTSPDLEDDESRQIYFDYAEARPSSSGKAKAKGKRTRRYVRKTPKTIPTPSVQATDSARSNGAIVSQVGVTIWKLRPSSEADEKDTRILDQEEADDETELTPVRIEADSLLKIRDKVRLSIESPRAGFLYVIDREIYADGTMSDPYLIFPTLGTHGGDNNVRAGLLVDIPAQTDHVKFFTMKPSRPDQTGEALTIVITATPLDLPPLQRKYMRLDEKKVSQWEREWKAGVERFEMEGGAGLPWTKEEKAAGADTSRLLDQEDPAPQTIYRAVVKLGAPVMITIPLRYAGSAAPGSSKE